MRVGQRLLYSALYLKETEDTLRLIFITCINSFILLVLLVYNPYEMGPW